MDNAVNWFEIPATDFQRAVNFYETILGIKMTILPKIPDMPPMNYVMFPFDEKQQKIGGGICDGEGYEPSATGSIVYLNAGEDLSVALNKVKGAGGKILVPKMSIGSNGFMAHFIDTEGNRVALHSPN